MIPIENLYYVLCYAWNRLDERELIDVSAMPHKSLPNLFAKILTNGTRHLFKMGLDREYREYAETTGSLSGKIDLGVSIKKLLFEIPRMHCITDELSHDVLHNQVLKATLSSLASCSDVDTERRHELSVLVRQLHNISTIELSRSVFPRVRLHRNIAFYGFLINVCELVFDSMLPAQDEGNYRFRNFLRDEVKMRKVFQDFVFNFYKLEQREFDVSSRKVPWNVLAASKGAEKFLPEMITDVTLTKGHCAIVIDTKYYQEALQTNWGKLTSRSGHLYQIQNYVQNLAARDSSLKTCEGILLYPTVDQALDLAYDINGHRVRVVTIDLNRPWQDIERALLQLPTNAPEMEFVTL